jgi:hypothetical protein
MKNDELKAEVIMVADRSQADFEIVGIRLSNAV